MIIDANDMIVGRIATKAAKSALLGEKVEIINCENAVITGNKDETLNRYKKKRAMGTHSTGPFIHRMPDRFVKRIIRGMLPYKQQKGREAFKRIRCHIGIPDEFKEKEAVRYKELSIAKLPTNNYIRIKTICRFMGAKI